MAKSNHTYFQGRQSAVCMCLPFNNVSNLKVNIFAHRGNKIIFFKADPFSDGSLSAEEKSHQSYPPCKNWRKLFRVHPGYWKRTMQMIYADDTVET